MDRLHGTGVALVTPFDKKRNIDFAALKKLLQHTAKGVDYYVVMGTTGESATISKEEKKEVLQFVLKNNSKQLPVVFGIGGNSTQEVLNTLSETNLAGVNAILSVSPYYNKPSQEGIVQHFNAIADVSPVPVILYNVPGRTSSNLSAATTLRLAQHKNIIGIKEASGNIEQCMNIMKSKPKNFMLISGDDLLTLALYAIGGVGVISVLANSFPVIFKNIRGAVRQNDFRKASSEQFKLLEINGPMYEEGNPVGVKFVLEEMGVCHHYTRLPLCSPSNELKSKIKKILSRK
ncbi:MAG: 4-hydroxy-tetrahydrodipicolinate synthase [Flammeovirgaceae bacterium]|nr:4-hydroxy-tetrahydrodipicolinate synthase [Flammeovirgaceae bacterium]